MKVLPNAFAQGMYSIIFILASVQSKFFTNIHFTQVAHIVVFHTALIISIYNKRFRNSQYFPTINSFYIFCYNLCIIKIINKIILFIILYSKSNMCNFTEYKRYK